MSLLDKIESDLIVSLKDNDTGKVSVLRLLKSSIKNAEIEKGDNLTDSDILKIIEKQAKQRRDSIELYQSGNRADLASGEKAELEILNLYLPEKLSREDISKVVNEVVAEKGATSLKDMGLIIKSVMEKLGDQAEGKIVSELVKEKLA